MNINDFLADYGSTTECFKRISDNFHLIVINNWKENNYYHRLVAIHVDDVLVLLGLSKAHLRDSPFFVAILANSGTQAIGNRLFAPDSGIIRANMLNQAITFAEVDNQIIKDYLLAQQLTNQNIINYRNSTFIYEQQEMQLEEYFLPNLSTIINKK